MPHRLLAAVLAAAFAASVAERPVAAERLAELVRLPAPAGLARLLLPPAPPEHVPLVILLPDAVGEDGRAEPYAEALSWRGIASLTLGLAEDADAPDAPATEPASTPAAGQAALRWAAGSGFARIGLLGFGAGGRAALAEAGGHPVAALYPGCHGLAPAPGATGLLVVGAEAPDAAACVGLRLPQGLVLHVLPAGHGWDVPGTRPGGALLPDPAGGPRLRAEFDPALAAFVAEGIAARFEAALRPGVEAAR